MPSVTIYSQLFDIIDGHNRLPLERKVSHMSHMNMNRSFVAFLLALALLLSLCACANDSPSLVSMRRNVAEGIAAPELLTNGGMPENGADTADSVITLSRTDQAGAKRAMKNAIEKVEAKCDVSAYGIKTDQAGNLFAEIVNSTPEFFYLSSGIKFSYNKTTGIVSEITFEYTMTKSEITQARKYFSEQIEAIISKMPSDITQPVDIALWFHDYICLNFAYDADLKVSDVYNFLKGGRGICQAYVLLYMELMTRMGVSCDFVTSTQMKHIWNILKIDDQWYHVDLTWDDSLPDTPGRARHDTFLCSDSALKRVGHADGWSAPTVCTSSRFDSESLDVIDTAFVRIDGKWYAADRKSGEICEFDLVGMSRQGVYFVDRLWRVNGSPSGTFYRDRYLSICAIDGKLCFSDPDSVYCLDLPTKIAVKIASYTGNGCIYTLVSNDGSRLEYTVRTTPGSQPIDTINFTPSFPEFHRDLADSDGAPTPLLSLKRSDNGQSFDFRVVLACNDRSLIDRSDCRLELAFERGEMPVKSFSYKLLDNIYLYRAIVDKDAVYTAASGQCLFGAAIDGIPTSDVDTATLLLRDDLSGNILFEYRVPLSEM